MKWTAGYNNSVAYTNGYFQEQSPSFLNACLAMQRVTPPSGTTFTYCELGSGQGLTSLILAATHPEGEFYACDFNPVHVLSALSIRDEARLPNLTLLENSFSELADERVDLPLFDYITLHGVLSWISDETRAQVVRFLNRYLKPGGVVQVSYNVMAGCAQILPLQRLLSRGARRGGAGWEEASAMAKRLAGVDALHFARNPDSMARLQDFDTKDPRYLAHEYLHESWKPLYFADIARELEAAKLTYAGSARFACMAPVGWIGDEQRKLLDTVTDPVESEEMLDYLANRSFRSDIFVRGKVPLSDARLRQQAGHVHLWGKPGIAYNLAVELEHAVVTRNDGVHRTLFELLHDSEMTLAQVFDAPEFAGMTLDAILKAVRIAIAAGEISVRYGDIRPRVQADQLNDVLLSRAEWGEVWNALASPRLGGGEGVSTLDLLMIAALHKKADRTRALGEDIDELTSRVKRSLALTGLHLQMGETAVPQDDTEKRLAHIFANSGNKLIEHSTERGIWLAEKAKAELG
jgi:SAM-dependent methyltransferase